MKVGFIFQLKEENLFQKNTLEIGAGNLNHLKYEGKVNLHNYSIIEPKKYLLKIISI